jgi:hypothetical protein
LAIHKHKILKTISYPGIGISPRDILLDSAMAKAFNFPGMVPEKNRPPTDWDVTPYSIVTHGSDNTASTLTLGAQTAIFIRLNPEV